MSDRLRVAILGSSGSIGLQALDVARRNPDKVEVVALAVNSNTELLAAQAAEFAVMHLAVGDAAHLSDGVLSDLPVGAHLGGGLAAVTSLVTLDEVDVVLNALVGAAGLRASHLALSSGKTLALANKESLVIGGDLIMPLATHDTLLPVDSEHSAIYQCYLGENASEASRIWLTASGGPFRGKTRAELAGVTRDDALAHPTWQMGPKITIDSSTLMNKGLEAIEAHHLFNVDLDAIRIVVHPQSCIHSMVEYRDGSVKAHLGATDMRIPIQFAFSYPHRWDAPGLEPIDFVELGKLEFFEPDYQTFRCLSLALDAGSMGGTMPAVMNAANEIAVAAFLARECTFHGIDHIVGAVMASHDVIPVESLEHIEEVDAWARAKAKDILLSIR